MGYIRKGVKNWQVFSLILNLQKKLGNDMQHAPHYQVMKERIYTHFLRMPSLNAICSQDK